jgi:shikimate kinase
VTDALPDARHLVLIGLMGAGKTTVGRRCATRLGRPFVDTDDLVVALAGMPFTEFFAEYGEPAFRALEQQAVADVSASPEPLVIACGGGTVIDPENRRRLRATGTVIWLQAPVPVLASRVGSGASRPLLAGDPVGALTRLGAAREAAYEASAHGQVDTFDRDIDDVADAVLDVFLGADA